MIAGDPDPVDGIGHPAQACCVGPAQPPGAPDIVEAVAQADDGFRSVALDSRFQPPQRVGRVIRWQQPAAAGEGRAFLQMQIGHRQQAAVRPSERAGEIGQQLGAVEMERRWLRHSGNCGAGSSAIASSISSCAASSSSSSKAAP